MSGLRSDVKYALRMLVKSPGFTFAAIAALALGIGANTAIFTVVDAVLLKPLSYPDADRIVEFGTRSTTLANFLSNVPEFQEYARQTSTFQEVAAYDMGGPGFNLAGDRPEQVRGLHVTEGYFRLFGAPVMLGRTFTVQEDRPNGGRVVVLSFDLWQRKFASDPTVVGRSLSLGNESYTIVGVIGKAFQADPEADLWVPFQFPPASRDMNNYFHVAGLLGSGVTLERARTQLKAAVLEYRRIFPETEPQRQFHIEPLRDSIVGDARKSLLVMLGAVSLVLLIACSNVANLLLARAGARRREFAIRYSLGAGRLRIVGQLLIESVLLAGAGGALGMGLGFVGVRVLLTVSPAGLPRIGENGSAPGMDWHVLVFTLGVSLATGILFGLFPSLTASRTDLNSALKECSGRAGTGYRQGRARSLLVVSEISLALVLMIGSLLMIRTFIALHRVGPGFNPQKVLTMEMSLTGERFQKTQGVVEVIRHGREQLNAIPGVEASAAGYWLPVHVGDALPFQIAGEPTDKDHQYGSQWMSITPGYLTVFQIPVLDGRDISERDTADAPKVALINEALAERYFPGQNPIGRQITTSKGYGPELEEATRTIVGVIGDTHNAGLAKDSAPMVIAPIGQVSDAYQASYANVQPLFWVVRTRGEPRAVLASVEEQLRMVSGGFPVAHVRTMEEVLGRSTDSENFKTMLLTIFGAIAMLLAAIGIYGLMAYAVEQRHQEMGVRMALGADRSAIRQLVIWSGMRVAMMGIAIGMAAALALTRLMSSFLFQVRPWDPVAFLCAPLILSLVVLLAIWLPGARASKADLVQVLRAE